MEADAFYCFFEISDFTIFEKHEELAEKLEVQGGRMMSSKTLRSIRSFTRTIKVMK